MFQPLQEELMIVEGTEDRGVRCLDTRGFLHLLCDPEWLRGFLKCRILRPESEKREFFLFPHGEGDFPPDVAEPSCTVCDIDSYSVDCGSSVACMKVYGMMPIDLAHLIFLRAHRRTRCRKSTLVTHSFQVDGFHRSDPPYKHGPSNFLIDSRGDIASIPFLFGDKRVIDIDLVRHEDAVKIQALVIERGLTKCYHLRKHAPDFSAVTIGAEAWLRQTDTPHLCAVVPKDEPARV